ncbi:hypothetical protein LI90_2001 [Carbonactinospora thermoautotrophica]|uniref:YncI copper-binding domain-containing protein n=1 Tax=Carbonactinospora thermoautotrophica TaxID=1469144 RepID=A0A132MT03_9ACTN|nr:YcnI family protein [Carbonactinospora thermoautotrophica]KWX00973.1 hypothetical protein LI90_2001 [Carbonactinospora thermoautotrophica]
MTRIRSRLLATSGGAIALVVSCALPAAAHVTVVPQEAEQGSYTTLTFRVPNERDDARTVKLEIVIPQEQPLTSVRVKPHPGWSYQLEKVKLDQPVEAHGSQVTEVVRKITWTAGANAGIGATEFEEFQISIGRLPTAERMVFKALQTYDSGEVVRWIEEAAPGATTEPEHPAPVLKLVPKADETPEPTAEVAAKDDDPALILSVAALLLGAGGLAAGISARRR